MTRFVNQMKVVNWQRWQIIIFGLFLAWFIGANVWLATQESQTIDEAAHITAGYSYLTTRDYRLNPEHPPLLKELSALPLLVLNVKDVKTLSGWQNGDEWKAGKDFVYSSQSSPRTILFMARVIPILIATILGLLVFTLAAYFTNVSFGLFALGLYCFDPNILAHSHLVTTDVASALGFLAGFGALFYYINRPTLKRLTIVGLVTGLALSLKFSTILLTPFIVFILGVGIFYFEKSGLPIAAKIYSLIKRLVFVAIIAIVVLWIIYGFEVVKPGSSSAFAGGLAQGNPVFNHLRNMYVPLYSYLRGLGRVLVHGEKGDKLSDVYLLGHYAKSYWYYFLVAGLVKTPLAILAGVLVSAVAGAKYLYRSSTSRVKLVKQDFYVICLVLFCLVYLIGSTFTSINIGWRHILPIYPVFYIIIAYSFYHFRHKLFSRRLKPLVLAGLLWLALVVSLAVHWPYNLSYANEVLPIINHGTNWPRLTDSNLDWGQDMYRLIKAAKNNPNKIYYYEVFSNANLNALGAPDNLRPITRQFNSAGCTLYASGTLVVSYQIVYNDTNDNYSCLRGSKPAQTIGSSIIITNVSIGN